MTSIQEAIGYITAQAKSFGTEQISINDAIGRVLAESIIADRDYPPFNRATMDGYALQADDILEKNITDFTVVEHLYAGSVAQKQVSPGTCIKIMTGAPVPSGADAVIRVEDATVIGDRVSFGVYNFRKGQNIARQGEDARQGSVIIPDKQWISTQIISGLAVAGYANVQVKKLPDVAILSTGNEVVPVATPILPHQIRDSNSYAIKYFLKKFQIHAPAYFLVPDNKALLTDTLQSQLHKDIIILTGGVSKGDADYVPEVLQALGVKQIFHRIKIKPGAPLWFGVSPSGGVVFGLPGNPVSVQVACKLFVESYLRTCFGMALQTPLFLPFMSTKSKKTKFDEYFPCKLITQSTITGIVPSAYNSSGDIAATLGSDGIALHPEHTETLSAHMPVQFLFW